MTDPVPNRLDDEGADWELVLNRLAMVEEATAEVERRIRGSSMRQWYDRKGNPIDYGQMDWDNNVVEFTTLSDVEVSTVHLGLDHRYRGDGPPLIFETMVFGGEYDQMTWRYATEEAALEGHKTFVEALQAGDNPYDLLSD